MKKISILGLLILISACASKKDKFTANYERIELESLCPEDGKCSIKLLKNKSLQLKNDEFGNLFYNLINDDSKIIVVFNYDRNVPEDLQDGTYREEILIEIDKTSGLPTDSKIVFGRFCYCKGETGYYKISEKINLISEKFKNIYELSFKTQVPQIISDLKFSIN